MQTLGVLGVLSILGPLSIFVLISVYAGKIETWIRKIHFNDKQ